MDGARGFCGTCRFVETAARLVGLAAALDGFWIGALFLGGALGGYGMHLLAHSGLIDA